MISFNELLLSLKNLNHDDLLSIQLLIANLLTKYQSNGISIQLEKIKVGYFELVASHTDVSESALSFEELSKAIETLDGKQIVLVDLIIEFILHNFDLKETIPLILQKTKKHIILSRGIIEIKYPVFELSKLDVSNKRKT